MVNQKIKAFLKDKRELLSYLFFGVATTFVGWFIYFAVLLGGKWLFSIPPEQTSGTRYLVLYTVAQIVQWVGAVLFAFFTNKKWVFTNSDSKKSTTHQLAVFASGRLLTFALDFFVTLLGGTLLSLLLPSLSSVAMLGKVININEFAAKFVAAVLVIIGNYFFSKFLVFKSYKS